MEMVNLKTGTDSYQDESGETKTRDEYPWGLCITLNNDTLNKLKAQPQNVGTEVMITAKAVIKGVVVKFFWTRRSDGRVMHRRATGRQG
ncbi:hypothetical protein LNT19_27655, partial [Klebsiella pneumoniae]|nr:hypothetical protein [Klebsiella pneumoniae]